VCSVLPAATSGGDEHDLIAGQSLECLASSPYTLRLMRFPLLRIVALLCVTAVSLAVPSTWNGVAAAAERYTARLQNGTLISGREITDWHKTEAQPELHGSNGKHALLSPSNHVHWLRDNTLPLPATPAAYVEFVGGDRLPGKVTAYGTGEESPLDRQPPHLMVEHPRGLDSPEEERKSLRAVTRWLRRIVWQARAGDRYQPGTLWTRDGRRLPFRSLRFTASGVRVLLEETTQEMPFTQIAELHMPRSDPWDAYYEQLAAMACDANSRLLRIETSDGLIATTSTDRFAARSHESRKPEHWYHMVQPAWSLDPIWARHHTIQLRRYHLAHRPALSDIEPGEISPPAGAGHWEWQKDRSAQGGPLRAGGEGFGWGIGDHAPRAISFPLPAEARLFRTRLALDETAGTGGCVRASVHLGNASTTPLFRTDLLIGSKTIVSPATITLPTNKELQGSVRVLTLVSDAAHRERPPDADPLNIRDFVDWLEPELELDGESLRKQLRGRFAAAVTAWDGWSLSGPDKKTDPAEPIELSSRWDDTDARRAAFRLEVEPRAAGLILSRSLKLGPRDNWLCLAVARFRGTAKIEVRVSGKRVATLDVPERQEARSEPDALVVSLREYQGKEVSLEIALPKEKLDWRGIAITRARPGLLAIFDEESDFAKRLNRGDGKAEVVDTDCYLGAVSLKVTPSERGSARLWNTPLAIRERPRLGEYRYLRFAWKKQGGERIALQIGHDGRFGPDDPKETAPGKSFRFDAGRGAASFGAAIRVANKPPSEWTVYTRDLYAEFGNFDLTGLSFAALDGDHALFDHLYLARTLDDLQNIEVRAATK